MVRKGRNHGLEGLRDDTEGIEGYKKTEVGVIPDDWDCEVLKGKIAITHGFGFKSQYFNSQGLYRLTTPGHFYEEGGFREVGEKQKYYDGLLPNGYLLRTRDLIVAMTEQADGLLGSAAIIPESGNYLHNQRLGKVKPISPDIELGFLYYIFNSKKFRLKVRETAAGTKVKHTSPNKLLEIAVPLPSLPEQKAIAQSLSDVDAMITECDRIISKKRNTKQGTMQQLLTGKKRLPGFSGKWKVKKLEMVAPLQRGFDLPTSQLIKGNYPVVYSNGILNFHNKYQAKAPGVVTGRSGTIGKVTFVEADYWPHNTSLWVTDFKENSPKFIYYLYIFIGLERFGTGSGVPTLNRNDVHAFQIPLPPNQEEQKAIAQILSDMDTEIAALEQKRDKYKAIKQGMMQELLTGKTRLINK